MNFVREIFQDIDGGFSMKRTIAFAFLVGIIAIVVYVTYYGVTVRAGQTAAYAIPQQTLAFLQDALGKLIEGVKWIVGIIATEQVTKFAPQNKE